MHRSCYADEIELDLRAAVDLDRTHYTADEWLEMVKRFHTQFDGAEHLLMPEGIHVDGDTATCYVNLNASHFKRTANGWKISKGTQTMRWGEGNWQMHTDAGLPRYGRSSSGNAHEAGPDRKVPAEFYGL
jgi:hypothetical protein